MQFTSLNFILFFAIFYTFYIVFHRRLWLQNLWLLLVSYVFYSFFGVRFLAILIFMTITDFSLGWLMGKLNPNDNHEARIRGLLVSLALVIDLGLLILFKYFNYFRGDFIKVWDVIGLNADKITSDFLLPIGISFYALKSISYILDVYRGKQTPTTNLLDYSIYVAFFPALLAGPIDRASNLLRQIHQPRRIAPEQVLAGLSLILWGYFKKVVIADNLAVIVNQVFQVTAESSGLDVLLGILAFSIQIYADFSGYSDIARGFARLIGFELMVNFKLPYFALNPAEFWQRWHISLSEWLRDYIFYPVRRLILKWKVKNMALWGLLLPPLITMVVSGAWHGVGWNFIFWGIYHAVLMIIYRVFGSVNFPKSMNLVWNSHFGTLIRMVIMFGLVTFGWLFFRADTVGQAFQMMANVSLTHSTQTTSFANDLIFFSTPLLLVQLWQALKGDLMIYPKGRLPVQVVINTLIAVWIVVFGAGEITEFIYSQF